MHGQNLRHAGAGQTLTHQAFSPSAEERDYARRLVAAYAEATARRMSTIDFEGRMIDGPLLKRAQAIVAAPGVKPCYAKWL